MIVEYLNLARRPDRDARFRRLNDGIVEFQRVEAVDGRAFEPGRSLPAGFGEVGLEYPAGAVGCALSHKQFWERAAAGNGIRTLAEDDAVFHRRFRSSAERVFAELPPEWDLILWGWNFNSVLHVENLPGLTDAIINFPTHVLRERIGEFQEAQYTSHPMRLRNAFGLVCYSVTPQGAAALLGKCFPLRDEYVPIEGLKRNVANRGIDVAMNKHYRSLRAFVCNPPLVWTENDPNLSDIVDREA
jgi:glycosyl transferase family 25